MVRAIRVGPLRRCDHDLKVEGGVVWCTKCDRVGHLQPTTVEELQVKMGHLVAQEG